MRAQVQYSIESRDLKRPGFRILNKRDSEEYCTRCLLAQPVTYTGTTLGRHYLTQALHYAGSTLHSLLLMQLNVSSSTRLPF